MRSLLEELSTLHSIRPSARGLPLPPNVGNFNHLFKPTIDRLAHLLMRQYGCRMSYLHLTALQRDVLPTVRNNLSLGQSVRSRNCYFIPVFLHRRLAGAAQVFEFEGMSDRELRLMQHTVQMVIESTLLNLDRIQLLDELEEHLKNIQASTNVLPLSHYRSNPYPLENKSDLRKDQFDFACLIEGRSLDDIFKMALEIHHHSGRYAFLPFQDLTDDVWDSNEELRRLGHATIFVDNIFRLPLERQKFLAQYLPVRERLASPQIIVGTIASYGELKTHKDICPQFLDEITIGYLQMTQPFSDYKRENLIDFFFGELSGRNHIIADMFDSPTDILPPH